MSRIHPKGKSQATMTANMVRAIRADMQSVCESLKVAETEYREGSSNGALTVDLAFDFARRTMGAWHSFVRPSR